jgi:hypothetical protein
MNRDAGIKQRGPVAASQIMKSRLAEAEQTGAPRKFLEKFLGLCGFMNENSSSFSGAAGNIKAPAGRRIRPRSTSTPSGQRA